MRVFYVSKACAVSAYQHKLTALSAHADVHALVPTRWGGLRTVTNGSSPARIRATYALLHGRNHLHVYPAAGSALHAAQPDIVHIDEEPYSAVTFQLARIAARARRPFLFFAWQNLEKPVPWPFSAMRAYVFSRAACAIAGTDQAAAVLRAAGWRGETAVIPQFGVDPDAFRPNAAARARTRTTLGIPGDVFVAGYAGRLVPEKGVDLLLDAAAADPAVHLLLIGDGPEGERLRRQAALRGLAGRAHFAGLVDSLAMPAWLNALDALVLPSRTTPRWSEQFGRVLVEAMACGVPVAGAASGEIAHVIGGAGRTFPEGDAAALAALLRELRTTPTLREQLRAAGHERVHARFTQERIVRDTAAVYAAMLAGRSEAA